MKTRVSRYGWQPDIPDYRDLSYSVTRSLASKLPAKVDLTPHCPPVYDQGQLGSCTANAIGAAFQFNLMKQKAQVFMPSRLFIYYNERVIENTINIDNGAQIRNGVKTLNKLGVCNEDDWTYIEAEFAQKPHLQCYKEAINHQALSYQRVQRDLKHLKGCLAEGYPIIFGFTVYDAFEEEKVAKTGVLNMPAKGEKFAGGHAVLAVGYDDASKRFIVRNSWGKKWGKKGYFTMPYDYLLNENLSDDFWTIRIVEANPVAVKKAAKPKNKK